MNMLWTDMSIGQQFNILRLSSTEHPAWFEHNGRRYKVSIEDY
jgi:hypothetical protein